ncbi:hypothetical protein [Amycolatopsis sp. H20-H5]|uniref:hypothetical protein n=1 Tax=Amycolatopsis sp. H20-H5 TaxID=3046309 RepID=UPI002DBB7C8F|nr:hypothetical protein [Amycolatopsis sp. H20-H5]MEC3979073.1 hypothetical protein [Amycolatopsis sp. H20-H5]
MSRDLTAAEPGTTVIDCYSKMVTGWSMADHYKTSLMRKSVGHIGICWDNAMAKFSFGASKNKWIHRVTFTTSMEARKSIVH